MIVHFSCFLLQNWTVNQMMIDYTYKTTKLVIFMRLGAKRSWSFPETQYHWPGLCSGWIHTLSSFIRPVAQESFGTVLTSLWQNQCSDIYLLKEELSDITVVIWNVFEFFFLFFPKSPDEINSVYEINTICSFVQIMTDSLISTRIFHQEWFRIQN